MPLLEVLLIDHHQKRLGMGIKCLRHAGQGQLAAAFRQRSTCLGNSPDGMIPMGLNRPWDRKRRIMFVSGLILSGPSNTWTI
jgi:hypothetical protein